MSRPAVLFSHSQKKRVRGYPRKGWKDQFFDESLHDRVYKHKLQEPYYLFGPNDRQAWLDQCGFGERQKNYKLN
jgi:hypothetical protein